MRSAGVCSTASTGHVRTHGTPQEKLGLLPLAQEHILALEDGKSRLLKAVKELSLAFALAVPDDRALAIRDDVAFFQAVRAALVKSTVEGERTCGGYRSCHPPDHLPCSGHRSGHRYLLRCWS